MHLEISVKCHFSYFGVMTAEKDNEKTAAKLYM